jgi:hypothetical protein
MWLAWLAGALVILALIGAVFLGGIFTIALVPLAVVAMISAAWSLIAARMAQRASGAPGQSGGKPAPLPTSSRRRDAGPHSPEELVDARRAQQ